MRARTSASWAAARRRLSDMDGPSAARPPLQGLGDIIEFGAELVLAGEVVVALQQDAGHLDPGRQFLQEGQGGGRGAAGVSVVIGPVALDAAGDVAVGD